MQFQCKRCRNGDTGLKGGWTYVHPLKAQLSARPAAEQEDSGKRQGPPTRMWEEAWTYGRECSLKQNWNGIHDRRWASAGSHATRGCLLLQQSVA